MKQEVKKFINETLNFFKPNDNDHDAIKDLKIENSGNLLFLILKDLFNDCSKIENIVLNKFEIYEQIYADIVSSQLNPSCSCRYRVIKYFSNNIEKIYKTLLDIIDNNPLSETTYNNIYQNTKSQITSYEQHVSSDSIVQKNNPRYISGQIWEIEDNPIEYGKTIKALKESQSIYKGMSIIKVENRLKLYFY